MSDNIIQLNQEIIHNELKDLVRNSVEETLNALLDNEAEQLVELLQNRCVPQKLSKRMLADGSYEELP